RQFLGGRFRGGWLVGGGLGSLGELGRCGDRGAGCGSGALEERTTACLAVLGIAVLGSVFHGGLLAGVGMDAERIICFANTFNTKPRRTTASTRRTQRHEERKGREMRPSLSRLRQGRESL